MADETQTELKQEENLISGSITILDMSELSPLSAVIESSIISKIIYSKNSKNFIPAWDKKQTLIPDIKYGSQIVFSQDSTETPKGLYVKWTEISVDSEGKTVTKSIEPPKGSSQTGTDSALPAAAEPEISPPTEELESKSEESEISSLAEGYSNDINYIKLSLENPFAQNPDEKNSDPKIILIKYICDIQYYDIVLAQYVKTSTDITFTYEEEQLTIGSCSIKGKTYFAYNENGVIKGDDTITLAGEFQNSTFHAWLLQLYDKNAKAYYWAQRNGDEWVDIHQNGQDVINQEEYYDLEIASGLIPDNGSLLVRLVAKKFNDTFTDDYHEIVNVYDGVGAEPGLYTIDISNEDIFVSEDMIGEENELDGGQLTFSTLITLYKAGNPVETSKWTLTLKDIDGNTLVEDTDYNIRDDLPPDSMEGQDIYSIECIFNKYPKDNVIYVDINYTGETEPEDDVNTIPQRKITFHTLPKGTPIHRIILNPQVVNYSEYDLKSPEPIYVTVSKHESNQSPILEPEEIDLYISRNQESWTKIERPTTDDKYYFTLDSEDDETGVWIRAVLPNETDPENYVDEQSLTFVHNSVGIVAEIDNIYSTISCDNDRKVLESSTIPINVQLFYDEKPWPISYITLNGIELDGNPQIIYGDEESFHLKATAAFAFDEENQKENNKIADITIEVPEGSITQEFPAGVITLPIIINYTRNESQYYVQKAFTLNANLRGVDPITVQIVPTDGNSNIISGHEESTTLQAILYKAGEVFTPETEGSVKWTWECYDNQWVEIKTDNTNFELDDNKLTVYKKGIQNSLNIRVIATVMGKPYDAYISVYDRTDPLQVSIISTLGDKILNHQGMGVLYPRVWSNGVEVDELFDTFTITVGSDNEKPESPENNDRYFAVRDDDGKIKATLYRYDDSDGWVEDETTYDYTYTWTFTDSNGNPTKFMDSSGKEEYEINERFLFVDSSRIHDKVTFHLKVEGKGGSN